MSYKYFYLSDGAHGKCVVAGDRYDGKVRHQDHKSRDNAQWRFEPVADADGYYHIFDRRHSKAIIAGDNYDGILHHQDPGGRLNARWRIEKGSRFGTFVLIDGKHGKALIAGDRYDGHLYHQPPNDRSNSLWALQLAQDGDEGPDFYIEKQELVNLELELDVATRLAIPPLVIDGLIINGSSVEQACEFNKTSTDILTEEWSFENSVTVGVLQSVTTKAGVEFSGISASCETRTEVKLETTAKWGRNVSKTTQSTIEWKIPVRVPENSTIHLNSEIKKSKLDVPFVATIRNTLGDGTTEDVEERGTWRGVEYQAGTINYRAVTTPA